MNSAVRFGSSLSFHQPSTLNHQLTRDGNRGCGGVIAGVGEADLDFADAVLLGEISGIARKNEFRRA
jgi:hypothetical protein